MACIVQLIFLGNAVQQVAAVALEFFAPGNFTGVLVGDAELLAPKLSALGGVRFQ